MNIRNLLLHQEQWVRTAIVDGDEATTFGDLARRAFAVGEALPREAGAHAALLLPDGGDCMAALFGVWMAGLVAFPLHVSWTRHEVRALLAQAHVAVVISARRFAAQLEGADAPILYIEDLPPWGEREPPPPCAIEEDAPLVLLATSGTTDRAKIVVLTERNVAFSAGHTLSKTEFQKHPGEDVRVLIGTPFSSAYGVMWLCVAASRGFAIVLLRRFTPDAFFRAIERHRITHYEGGTAAVLLLEQSIGRGMPYDIRTIRHFGFGGSGVSEETMRRVTAAYPGINFMPGYGMTEAAPLIAKPDFALPMDKLASVGSPARGMELAIEVAGIRAGAPFARGEIVVRAPSVMLGYYENEEETARTIREGWLHTGDVGYLDQDNYLYICGRMKNIVLVRGFTVYAEEVEQSLLQSGLARACRAYGEPDGLGGERLCADVVPAGEGVTAEAIRAWCRERLAGYKQPQRLQMVEAIEQTATGKTRRGPA